MIERNSRQRLSESALIAAIGVIFILAGTYIPLLGLLTFFTAVPYILITMRNGLRYGVMASVISAAGVSMFTDPIYGITLALLFFIPGVAIGYKGISSKEPFGPVAWGFITSIVLVMVYVKLMSILLGVDIIQRAIEMFEQAVKLQGDMIESFGKKQAAADVGELVEYMKLIIPGAIVVQAMLMSFFNYYLALSILKRTRGYSGSIPKLSEFTLPGNIALGMLIIYFLTMSAKGMAWINYENLMANITFIIIFMFFLQGFAVMGYFLNKSKINKFFRNTLLFTVIFLGPLSSIVSIVGFLDSIIDFRRIRK
ncbi:hypothetical protein EAL2_c22090 [Peptoclostridium acidaminophilum DSM 3953]|uniref:DUF2232 domain-containing protein n=1 Tax=Peptoclostridium acidaminophilum DSM 3953 TaxID=1286171 RepID=W8T6W9_PEPAC|nr:DUF2232 domain-containing protein [Peptoclostridium acidaminophilum]AHM57489.1 hypothetical protein EAL2_c22090 [Peptoclostridium acidaminophilum DSM 3953]